MIDKLLYKRVDNAPLIVFRIIFGLLLFLETFGAILTGWVRRTLVEPEFTFNFIGFDFLQPLPGMGMYFYFGFMAVLGIMVMLGYRYRLSLGLFTVMWTCVYLMQKSSYNNHYYLLILVCLFMLVVPADRYKSIDVRRNPERKSLDMPNWVRVVIILQLFIVYTYASVAKLYPDWLDLTVPARLMATKANYPVIGDLLQEPWVHASIAWFGILFDLLIIPLLLWKRTRNFALLLSVFFHLFNSIVLQIGIFPYLSLAFILFFYDPETIRKRFLKHKPAFENNPVQVPNYKNTLLLVGGIYFTVQILLPLRHHVIPDDVLWTEEGHRMSWRMMLRTKHGYITFEAVDKATGERIHIDHEAILSPKQRRIITTKPDVIWQFARRIKKDMAAQGKDVSVYVTRSKVSVNGRPLERFIRPDVDIAAEPWHTFRHETWIYPSKKGNE
ncbi:HTTM domain-containing protein [Robertkochia aurantiaca]|uniref:HTTM domain-containing protein n=1 Tax=Robertkochia aurantiaca TaxID=2873700 RepID=UPI001CCDA1EA|nr:HTTM domain-containing protein [Robertkochia sp. 3YJGBD-33]